jgi:hypothetical protein
MKSRKSLTRAWLWVSSAAALERCACSRVQMDVACGVWVPVGSGRPQDEL